MIKKLDTLILKAFIGPFIATFFITLFVLVLQFFWLYIDDIVGKGVDLLTVARLISYVSATLVPLALPLAVLLSSIMTFGNLGETFELIAIKSAGIPLLRFMRPLFIASLLICGLAFLFNNYFIPVANLKMNTLKYDIIVSKPAFDIKEGVFYDKIDGYVIKIGKKDKDGSTIHNVLIYEQNYQLQDDVIIADRGKMTVTPDKKSLQFKLQDGWLYREKGERQSTNTEFVRIGFKEYNKMFDLSSFKLNKTSDSAFKGNYQMLSMRQLDKNIDSVEKILTGYHTKMDKDLHVTLPFLKYLDTARATVKAPPIGKAKSFSELLPDSTRAAVRERTISTISGIKINLEQPAFLYNNQRQDLLQHLIAWHEKVTLSIACLVMFLIGAPLGSIIRKGGIGLPLVFAVIFFVIFFLLNNFGKKLVKQDVLQPIPGMWLATYVLTPIGLFLTYKALNDSQLFNKEFYFRIIKTIRALRAKRRAERDAKIVSGEL